MEPFEEHVRRQPLREIPADWRGQILSAARAAAPEMSRVPMQESLSVRLRQQIKAWLWPHPLAWSALGACWLVIAAVIFSLREPAPVMAQKEAPVTAETLTELKQERLMFAELAGLPSKPDVDRARKYVPQPRTEVANGEMV